MLRYKEVCQRSQKRKCLCYFDRISESDLSFPRCGWGSMFLYVRVRSCVQQKWTVYSLSRKECNKGYVVVPLPSHVQLFVTPWTAARQASLSLLISWSVPKFMSIALVMPSSHLIFWRPLLLLPLVFPSIRDFSNESTVSIKWPKYWSFNFSISPFSEYSGLISFKIDWFDFLWTVQGTFSSLLQHHSLKTSVLWSSAFFIVQLS